MHLISSFNYQGHKFLRQTTTFRYEDKNLPQKVLQC